MAYSILIVDDDADLLEFIRKAFVEEKYTVNIASDGVTALKIIKKTKPDIALLDMKLPDITGESLFTEIKKQYADIPIVFLTSDDDSSHIIHGFEIGADDYVTKPFVIGELLARIRARLRREKEISKETLIVDDLSLNTKTFEVTRNNKKIKLTPKEFRLLEYLMVNKNNVVTREQILASVWQYHFDVESRVVDIYIGMLRKKVDQGFKKKLIQSMIGFGYLIKE